MRQAQRSAARRQYELCVRTLDSELGVPPEGETTNLYHSIRSGQTAAPAEVESFIQPASSQDEVRMATVLVVDVDAGTEEDWDRRPDEIAIHIADFLQDAPGLFDRYEAQITRFHDSGFLVLVLEDLHWADSLSLDLIGHLMDMLADVPLLLLCVYRPESALAQDRLAQLALRKCPAAFNVAHFMADLITDDELFAQWKGQMPVIYSPK